MLTSPEPRREHTLPIVHGENRDMALLDEGFMMYWASASQVEVESGQHVLLLLFSQVSESQSWIAPNIWAAS